MRQINAEFGVDTANSLLKLINDHKALDLTVGWTKFPLPEQVANLLAKEMRQAHGRAPIEGVPELRKNVSDYIQKKYFRTYHPAAEIAITTGAAQAIFSAVAALVSDGDEVILFEPTRNDTALAIEVCGARPVYLKLHEDNASIDWQEVQKAVTPRTKLIIISSPNSLTGSILSSDDMENLQKLINGTKLKIISDETLSDIVCPGVIPSSVAFFPKLADNAYIIGSLSQSLGISDWDLGYCLAPAAMMDNFQRIQRAIANTSNHTLQLAISAYMSSNEILFPYQSEIQKNRQVLLNSLSSTGFKPLPIQAGYTQTLDYSDVSDLKDVEFAEMLVREYGVGVSPVSIYFHDKSIRKHLLLNLAVEGGVMTEAALRLSKLHSA
jgi:methionine aminotransferase